MKNIAIRVDESEIYGSGHISRCIALAQMLKSEFSSIKFYSKAISKKTSEIIKKDGFCQINISNEKQFLDEINQYSIVILDGYQFNSDDQLAIKNTSSKLICIDDRVKEIHYHCDALINYGIANLASDFRRDLSTQLYLGSRYYLLRNAFRAESRLPLRNKKRNNLFISFGNSDKNNYAAKIPFLLNLKKFDEISVVIGSAKSKAQLMSLASKYGSKIKVYKNLTDFEILRLMKKSKFSISPASTLMLELFTVGTHLVTGWFAESQKKSLSKYEDLKLVKNIGKFTVNKVKQIQFYLDLIPRKKNLKKQKEFIGDSQSNLVNIFKQL